MSEKHGQDFGAVRLTTLEAEAGFHVETTQAYPAVVSRQDALRLALAILKACNIERGLAVLDARDRYSSEVRVEPRDGDASEVDLVFTGAGTGRRDVRTLRRVDAAVCGLLLVATTGRHLTEEDERQRDGVIPLPEGWAESLVLPEGRRRRRARSAAA